MSDFVAVSVFFSPGIFSSGSVYSRLCFLVLAKFLFAGAPFVFALFGLTLQKIGKTTKENLDGEVTTTFPPLIMSTATLSLENVRVKAVYCFPLLSV